MPTYKSNVEQFHIKLPFKNKSEQFQHRCGECLLALQKYKLKSNFLGCHMNKQQYTKYYNYYESRPRKRLELISNKLHNLLRTFQRNSIYLQALQLKSLNNMMKIFRKKMGLFSNQPTSYNSTKFQKQQNQLSNLIIMNDLNKLADVQKIMQKIKEAEQAASASVDNKLQPTLKKKKSYERALKAINKSQTLYYRYFEAFQRSITLMISELHGNMEKLSQFYTAWENLGSSMIYQFKSDRQVFIDKTSESKSSKNYLNLDEDYDQILQVLDVVPPGSKIHENYQHKLQSFKFKGNRVNVNNSNTSFNKFNLNKKYKKGNLKISNHNVNRVSWFQTQSEDIEEINFSMYINLKQRQDNFFSYTYEELHSQTNHHLDQLRNKGISDEQRNYNDRFYVYSTRQNFKKLGGVIEKNNSSNMGLTCWYDRMGSKGAFNIQDLPINMFQRKLQFEFDRQIQMAVLDQKLRKQYSAKQQKLNIKVDPNTYNIGFKWLNQAEEAHRLRQHLISAYDPDNLPILKTVNRINQVDTAEPEFSDQEDNKQIKRAENTKILVQKEELKEKQQQILQQKQQQAKLPKKTQQIQANSYSSQFLQRLQFHQKQADKQILKKKDNTILQRKDIKSIYPWLQVKQKKIESLQVFAQRYLYQYDLIQVSKIKQNATKMGHHQQQQQQMQVISFKYLQDYEINTIQECINSANREANQKIETKSEKENLNKIYLVNQKLYAKLEPLFFHSAVKTIKVYIFLINGFQYQKFQQNLKKVLKIFGRCTFQLNVELNESLKSQDEKLYGLIGHLMRNIKFDRSTKSLFESCDKNIKYQDVIKRGKQIYQNFGKYYKHLNEK